MSARSHTPFKLLAAVLLAGFAWWPPAFGSVLLGLWLVLSLPELKPKTWKVRSIVWLACPALIIWIAWLLHGMPAYGASEVQLAVIWLVIGVLMSVERNRRVFKGAFVIWSLLQVLVVGVSIALVSTEGDAIFSYKIRSHVGDTFGLHPTLLASCWSIAGLIILQQHKFSMNSRLAGFGVLLAGTAMLGAKMPFAAQLLAGCFMLWIQLKGLKKWATLGGVACLGLTMLLTPVLRERLVRMTEVRLPFEAGQSLTSSELRYGIWTCSSTILSDHLLTGVGTGNTRSALDECYEQFEQEEFFQGEYNSHNQYLHFGLIGGVLSMLVFLGFWLHSLYRSWVNRDWNGAVVWISLMLLMLTENYFSRQVGITLMATAAIAHWWEVRSSTP